MATTYNRTPDGTESIELIHGFGRDLTTTQKLANFILDQVPGGGGDSTHVFYASEHSILPDGSDQSADFATLLTTVVAAGGGTIVFSPGTYVFLSKITIPNDGATPPRNVPIRLTGAGAFFSGQSAAPNGGTILDLRADGPVAKIDTRGLGMLEIDHLTLRSTVTGTSPFIHTTFTTLHIHQTGFYGFSQGLGAVEDGVVLGGLDGDDFSTTSDNAAFQGYGTVIRDNYFNRIKRAVVFQVHANAVVVKDNTIWQECGGECAIEINNGAEGSCVGNVIEGNLIEMPTYTYGIVLRNTAVSNRIVGNSFYDPGGSSVAAVRTEDLASGNTIQHSFADAALLGVSEETSVHSFFSTIAGIVNIIRNAYRFMVAAEFYAPPQHHYDADTFSFMQPNDNGWTHYQSDAGNNYPIYRAVATATTGVQVNLKGSTENVLGSDGILTFGSEFTDRWRIVTGHLLAKVDNTYDIGATGATRPRDVHVGRNLIAGAPIRTKGYTVATLPAGTQGDIAFVTDALTPTFLTVAVGGGAVVSPVFYDGTNWVTV